MPDPTTSPAAPAPATGAPEVSPSPGSSLPTSQPANPPSPSPTTERPRSWLHRLVHGPEPSKRAEPTTAEPASPGQGQETDGPARDAQGRFIAPDAIVLTQAELDRRVQAEADRRAAKAAKDAKRQQEKALRNADPYESARLRDEIEQEDAREHQTEEASAALTRSLGSLASDIDKATLDPLMLALDADTRKDVLAAGKDLHGLEQRAAIQKAAQAAFEAAIRADERAKVEAELRRNPTFRKELTRELRAQSAEPVRVAAATATNGHADMNALLRRKLGR